MHLSLKSSQMLCLIYLLTLLFSVLGALSNDTKERTCCTSTSDAHVKGAHISRCAHVHASKKCLEAYVFLLENGKLHCSSMNAKGIKATLRTLQKKGKPCAGTTKS